jgi:hypothetical protein
MGGLCQAPQNEVDNELLVQDLKFDSFRGINDQYFIIDKKNYIQYLTLSDMLQFIYSIVPDITKDKSYLDVVPINKLPILLKNKIIKHPLVIDHVNEDDRSHKVFVPFFSKSFKFIFKNYKKIHKDVHGKKWDIQDSIPKLCILPYAFQLTDNNTLNRYKVNIMFNIFAEQGELKKNNLDFKIFLYFMFVISTNVALLTLDEIAQEDEDVRKQIPEEVFLKIYSVYETKDSQEAVEEFLNSLFGDKSSLVYSDFEKSLMDNKLYYIFSNSGVRNYLENRNQSS